MHTSTHVESRASRSVVPVTRTKKVIDVSQAQRVVGVSIKYLGEMQRSWYMFAKTVQFIKKNKVWEILKYDSFKEFCVAEYQNLHYDTLVKMTIGADKFGKLIDKRLEDDPKYLPPPYESCYRLSAIESKIPELKFGELRDRVIEGELGIDPLREELKKIVDDIREKKMKRRKAIRKTPEELETELLADIKAEGKEEITVEEMEDVDIKSEILQLVSQLNIKTSFISENLPLLKIAIEKDTDLYTDEVVELANELESLNDKINDFFAFLENVKIEDK